MHYTTFYKHDKGIQYSDHDIERCSVERVKPFNTINVKNVQHYISISCSLYLVVIVIIIYTGRQHNTFHPTLMKI